MHNVYSMAGRPSKDGHQPIPVAKRTKISRQSTVKLGAWHIEDTTPNYIEDVK